MDTQKLPDEMPPIPVEVECGTVEAPAVESETGESAEEMARLLAEAEERGYKRGRNERIAELMEQPAQASDELAGTPSHGEPQILILSHIKPSVWD